MRFWRRRQTRPDRPEWMETAERLGLSDAPESRDLLAEQLGVPATLFDRVLRARSPVQPAIYLFTSRESLASVAWAKDFASGESGVKPANSSRHETNCLLVSESALATTSWRASRRVHRVLASLEATRSGGSLVELPSAPTFSEGVAVVARDVEAVARSLTPAVRGVLERALTRSSTPLTITVGQRHLLLTLPGSPAGTEAVEALLSDSLSLYAALLAAGSQPAEPTR